MASTEKYRYNSVDVARFIVAIANEKHISINITKVQKLLYIVHTKEQYKFYVFIL